MFSSETIYLLIQTHKVGRKVITRQTLVQGFNLHLNPCKLTRFLLDSDTHKRLTIKYLQCAMAACDAYWLFDSCFEKKNKRRKNQNR